MKSQFNSKLTSQNRFFVPDLTPFDRKVLNHLKPRMIFVAESPHINEVEPEQLKERRPLCGKAGKQWWSLLSELLEGHPNDDVSQEHLIDFCQKYRIGVLNAVQLPLDPKVAQLFPLADPVKNLGFSKVSGPHSFKKLKNSPQVSCALESLRKRLRHSSVAEVPIYCLGNDAEWFVKAALGGEDSEARVKEKIPHPSAWWRKSGLFGKIAREKLTKILKDRG